MTHRVETSDDDLRFRKIPGTKHFYAKHRSDIEAKITCLGPPMYFFTLTNGTRGVHLATAVSQTGTDVFHKVDEMNAMDEKVRNELFHGEEREYFVHARKQEWAFSPSATYQACQLHDDCNRTSLGDYLAENLKKSMVSKSLYNINRIYNEMERNLLTNIIMSRSNNLQVSYHHTLKEFGESTGWCHSHGLAWRERNTIDEQAVSKLHKKICDSENLSDEELHTFATFCDTVATVSLNPQRILDNFSDISMDRAMDITSLVKTVNRHTCTKKCHKEEKKEGCWYNYPAFPTTRTIIARPPDNGSDMAVKLFLRKTDIVKDCVQEELVRLRAEGMLEETTLLEVLSSALGGVIEETVINNQQTFT